MTMHPILWRSLVAWLVLVSSVAVATADDPSGTWTWSYKNTAGQTVNFSMKLKLEGNKLSGTIIGPQQETAIEDASYKDGDISFQVKTERDDTKYVSTYKGKQQGDAIKGTVKLDFADNARTYAWEPKREKP